MAAHLLSEASETIWFDKLRFDDAERLYQEKLSGLHSSHGQCQEHAVASSSSLVNEIARARKNIQNSLETNSVTAVSGGDNGIKITSARFEALETENKQLKKVTEKLTKLVEKLESRVIALETSAQAGSAAASQPTAVKLAPAADQDNDDDDDFELFGSDDDAEEDAAAAKLREERLAKYAEKKATKAPVIAKSNIILDVKPWDDETDMAELEKNVRTIEMDGLLWGASKLVAVGYGIKKLQICCVVVDDKVGTDDLEESITAFEDFVQSVDVAAFNKI